MFYIMNMYARNEVPLTCMNGVWCHLDIEEEFLTLRRYQKPFEKRSISPSNHIELELAQVMWN
jgi:hypothetical protein